MNFAAIGSSEAEAMLARDRSSTEGSLAEQYDQLDIASDVLGETTGHDEDSEKLFHHLYRCQRPSNATRVFVDLLDEDGPTCFEETEDLSTECSDQESAGDLGALDSDGAFDSVHDVEVHVDIDEEDDDVYFSAHKRVSLIQALPSSSQPAPAPISAVVPTELSIPTRPAAPTSSTSEVVAEVATPAAAASAFLALPEAGDNGLGAAELGRTRDSFSSEGRLSAASSAGSFLAELTSERSRGVRSHLERKLTKECEEEAC